MKSNERTLNIMFQKSGSGSISSRLALPKDWVNSMRITPDNRQVIAIFNEDKKEIIIKSANPSE
nr:MAG TPA: Toxin SymE, type I toxin-antitoxin system [Caudoviricetes sp.]